MNTYTVSEARKNLYDLVKSAAKGLTLYEITLRGEEESVILINKSELEAWQETLDILSNPEEAKAIRKGRKQKKVISHKEMLKEIGLS
ncbi:hypothetical protein A2773_06900 [Candidatus Gottesmanbacteria bacterium RIFCSPHIGHO2_01_FULL_39_10]|uniref:Antitoxin n=1 Tax=Candidatus Gottesmanbacteria bacterium RIFCSPHIGHO2_01_FULL_39_10 TaxID=1798375 RepID=A0A1F5ZQM8_9BACT|nr:MAG: hypothetical protein A2773_06900 [Candidatus Gottesmanbacteria bacterium RIFCSPHIGHO2_01_FULL_39_10]